VSGFSNIYRFFVFSLCHSWATKLIAIGCMSAQMIHEMEEGKGLIDNKVDSIYLTEPDDQKHQYIKSHGAPPLMAESMDRGLEPSAPYRR
jgi:hypothetical protein